VAGLPASHGPGAPKGELPRRDTVSHGMRTRIIFVFFVLLVLLSAHSIFASDLALVGAKVYLSPSEAPLGNATILIHDGRIAAVGPSSKLKPPRFASRPNS